MRGLLGHVLLGILFFLNWVLQIGLVIYAIYYVVIAFIEAGFLAGIISFFVASICMWLIHLVIGLILITLGALAVSLTEK